ncbi:MAG: MSHA biogenesis protein MshP [Aquabacterium sp.]
MLDRRLQRGLGVVAALLVLVLLSTLAAAVIRLNWTQQMASSQDIMGAKGLQAAQAGTEWGMFQALRGGWVGCTNSTQTLDLRSVNGFSVTVTCTSQATPYVEGADSAGAARSVRVYRITAVACTAASCPDNTQSTTATYVERQRQATVTSIDTDS